MPAFTLAPITAQQTQDLRHRVLRPHQTPAEMAYPGDDDPATLHLGAKDGGGAVVGILSLYRESMPGDSRPGDWRLRGMAVEPGMQGGGVGAALVQAGLDAVRAAGAARVWCNARTHACGFYGSVGFTRQGNPFDLPGIGEHYLMWIAVDPNDYHQIALAEAHGHRPWANRASTAQPAASAKLPRYDLKSRATRNPPMGLMTGKKGIVFGVANERSYAYFIAKSLVEQGAEVGFTFLPMGKMEHRVGKAVKALGIDEPWLVECDANDDASLDNVFAQWEKDHGTLDFVVHSIAFADKDYLKPDMFHQTPREAYRNAVDTSAYTLLAMAQRALPIMQKTDGNKTGPGGAMVNLSYYGGEKVTPGYNVMGIAKACLEHTTRYLAFELGQPDRNVRVNCISAGPFKTLAGAGVGGMDKMIAYQEYAASMKRCNTGEEVGDTAAYLLSDLSSGVTGETIHVDCGFSVVGVPPHKED